MTEDFSIVGRAVPIGTEPHSYGEGGYMPDYGRKGLWHNTGAYFDRPDSWEDLRIKIMNSEPTTTGSLRGKTESDVLDLLQALTGGTKDQAMSVLNQYRDQFVYEMKVVMAPNSNRALDEPLEAF